MDKKTINEDIVFEINPNYYVAVEYFGKQKVKVVVVDDFYKNPYLVRQLALDIPASRNKRIRGNNPAWRINAFYDMDGMSWIYDQLCKTYWPEIMQNYPIDYIQQSMMRATFMVNVMQTTNLPPVCPHMDNTSGINFASTIYLNTANESKGGTSFYNFGGKEYYDDPSVKHTYDVAGKLPVTKYISDTIHDWEMIGMVPMKFNRMVLYNQAVLHSAYVKEGMFEGDEYRLNQQFFI
tara:strand:- start:4172 stop:4879 length:708 start_codon:yes stop_codon:yes gene_type:complete